MTEQRERLERALRGCAESGVPDTVDLWHGISERVTEERASEARLSEEPAYDGTRQRARPPQLVPNTRLGWVLATLSVLILGAGIYVASGLVGEIFQQGLPGTVEPGSRKEAGQARKAQPNGEESGLKTQIGQTQTADGARVTLDWAYADEEFVMVGIRALDLREGDRENTESLRDPAMFQPILVDDSSGSEANRGNEAKFPPRVDIADGSGQDFDLVDGVTQYPDATAVFAASESIEPRARQRFRLEVPLEEYGMPGTGPNDKPAAGPFVFDFDVPVQPAPIVEVNQKVEANGVTLTLKRVVNSPGRPQAVVCVEPPDDEHFWTPRVKYSGGLPEDEMVSPLQLKDGCWSLTLENPVRSDSSVTVTKLDGMPRTSERMKTIRGPWTFEFVAPNP